MSSIFQNVSNMRNYKLQKRPNLVITTRKLAMTNLHNQPKQSKNK